MITYRAKLLKKLKNLKEDFMNKDIYCIYKLENLINNKFYIGKTKNFQGRKNKHFSELRNNSHHNIFLQRAFNKYGEESFKMYIIKDFLTEEEASILEESLIIETYDENYNVSKVSSGGDLISYHPNKEEIIKKRSESLKERLADEKIRKKLSEKMKGEGNPMYNKHHSDETRRKMSENHYLKGKKMTEEQRKNLSEAMKKAYAENPGKHIAISNGLKKRYKKEEHKLQTSESSKRNWQNPEYREKMVKMAQEQGLKRRKKIYGDGKIYFGSDEAAKDIGKSQPTIIHRIHSENFPNWYYLDEDKNIKGE